MLNLQDSLLLYYTQAEVQFSINFYKCVCLFVCWGGDGGGLIEAGLAGVKTCM